MCDIFCIHGMLIQLRMSADEKKNRRSAGNPIDGTNVAGDVDTPASRIRTANRVISQDRMKLIDEKNVKARTECHTNILWHLAEPFRKRMMERNLHAFYFKY